VQAQFRWLALRADYERTNGSIGHPNLLSLGITWTFQTIVKRRLAEAD